MSGRMAAGGSGGHGVIDFLRRNEAQLSAVRPCKPSLAAPVKATGWAASKAKLLDEACARARGNGRGLALEQRWGRLLIKMLEGMGSENFCVLAQDLVEEPSTLFELSLHPHGSQVLRAVLKQLALLLALPEMAAPREPGHTSSSRQALRQLLEILYSTATGCLCCKCASELVPS